MASGTDEKKSSLKSKVKFDLDCSQHTDETDEFLELSTLSNNPSLSSIDSTTNDPAVETKILPNNENKPMKKKYYRKMSGITDGSFSLRLSNMTTPKELCDLLGGTRVIDKVRFIFILYFQLIG
jgi:hypothetical protein